MELKWKAAFGVALTNDLLDWAGIGATPIIGDIGDILSSIALWPVLDKRQTALTLIELIPGGDVLPTYTTAVAWAYSQRDKSDSAGIRERMSDGMRSVEVK